MWKLLRNLLLSGLLLAGGAVAALWAVAQQQAAAFALRLTEVGAFTYESASAGIDGVLHLRSIRFVPKAGLLPGPIHAQELQVRSPGALWMLRRALTRDTEIPEALGLHLLGAKLPDLSLFGTDSDSAWLNTATLVPFESLGCKTAGRLGSSDYVAMGEVPQLPNLGLDYRYDAAARTLSLDLSASSARFAALRLHADLTEFSPQVFTQRAASSALRADAITFDYVDDGFFLRRNKFCARQGNVTLSAFVDQHVSAVLDVLKQRQIVVAESLAALYREVTNRGGTLHLLSLPNPGIAPDQYATYDPEQVLRFLNLTARHNDAPPVLFKLYFLAPEPTELTDIERALVMDPLAEPADALVVHAAPGDNELIGKPVAASPSSAVPIGGGVAVTAPRPIATTPASSLPPASRNPPPGATETAPVAPPAPPSQPTLPRTTAVSPGSSATAVAPAVTNRPATASGKSTGTPGLVVAATKPGPAATAPTTTRVEPLLDGKPLPPSATPPPANSTAALVWRGAGIERLPESERRREREFLVVAYEALSSHQGARITVITAGGKELEGTVESVDEAGITLSVQRETGRAEFYVERSRILEIRLSRRARG